MIPALWVGPISTLCYKMAELVGCILLPSIPSSQQQQQQHLCDLLQK